MIFIDCESAGLRGACFASAMINEDGSVVFNGFYRHPALESNPWLRENVAPHLDGVEFPDRISFLTAAAAAWNENKGDGAAVAHMGDPVESNFFQEMFLEGLIGEFEGRYPPLDTAPLLYAAGFDSTSEQKYAEAVGLELPKEYKPHSALSDAALTRLVWISLTK